MNSSSAMDRVMNPSIGRFLAATKYKGRLWAFAWPPSVLLPEDPYLTLYISTPTPVKTLRVKIGHSKDYQYEGQAFLDGRVLNQIRDTDEFDSIIEGDFRNFCTEPTLNDRKKMYADGGLHWTKIRIPLQYQISQQHWWNLEGTARSIQGLLVAEVIADSSRKTLVHFCVCYSANARPILCVVPIFTYQAYNAWGGYSYYRKIAPGGGAEDISSSDPDRAVSLCRPLLTDIDDHFGELDYPFVKWLDSTPDVVAGTDYSLYDRVDFCTDYDIHSNGDLLLHRRALFTLGHSEYWTSEQYGTIKEWVAKGGMYVNLGGNTCWRRVISETVSAPTNSPLEAGPARSNVWIKAEKQNQDYFYQRTEERETDLALTGLSTAFGGIGLKKGEYKINANLESNLQWIVHDPTTGASLRGSFLGPALGGNNDAEFDGVPFKEEHGRVVIDKNVTTADSVGGTEFPASLHFVATCTVAQGDCDEANPIYRVEPRLRRSPEEVTERYAVFCVNYLGKNKGPSRNVDLASGRSVVISVGTNRWISQLLDNGPAALITRNIFKKALERHTPHGSAIHREKRARGN